MTMQLEGRYLRVVLGASAICHAGAGIQFWLIRETLRLPQSWTAQFYFLLSVSFLLSLLLFRSPKKESGKFLYFPAKLLIFLVIGYAEGEYLGVEFTLLTLLVLEISAYFSLRQSVLLTTGTILVTLFNQRAIVAWQIPLEAVSLHDRFSLALYASIVAVLANSLRSAALRLDTQEVEAERLDRAVVQLMRANLSFQQYAVTAGEESAVQERKRISRDIHDTAVHTFITIIMLAESTLDLLETEGGNVSKILKKIILQAKDAVRDTRQALRELRAVEELPHRGITAISNLIKVFQEASGVQVDADFGNVPWEFGEKIDTCVYRMVQEGLSNAFRHGKATHITVRLWIFDTSDSSELIVRIHDNGQGSPEIKNGIGLQGMEERVKKHHGRLQAQNVPDGFEVTAWIPLK